LCFTRHKKAAKRGWRDGGGEAKHCPKYFKNKRDNF
jgi:hypothetical protein